MRSDTIDLADQSLVVDISDALSERDKVKFTVHTKTTLSDFQKPEFSVLRQHESSSGSTTPWRRARTTPG
ncbi:hypothetical protein HPB48_002222 [Haemaphysalis longicornis]|uniref:Uncharacterized protein n=1 Tax=Haemaphysalis longicornis TaxID=44386 RepID=A0A9J6FJZ2_HAELO|nr:hypothetical protein HPB48_002222 [Haemaphysalis longicornis]